jgi:(E)-4-hydroxy-3-methyl-but-2-enyl pyrophosphate reductase
MKIILAKNAGFCMGVRRAVDIVLREADSRNGPIYIYGPLIHNPQAMEWLRAKNVWILNDLEKLREGMVMVIRTHGISSQERNIIKEKGSHICDATCPRVGRIQSIIKRQRKKGFWTIIIGDKGHPEVEALLAFAGEKGIIVEKENDIDALPLFDKVCVVCQSTQNRKKFRRFSKILREKYKNCIVFDTLCDSTLERQREVKRLAKKVEAMIVVGGRNSANTRQLAAISSATNTPTFHIETDKELKPEMVEDYDIIGVTGGASTPHWIIRQVISRLKELKRRGRIANWLIKAAHFLINSYLYVALGAACLSYATFILLGIPPQWKLIIMVFSYIFSIHIINYFTDKSAFQLAQPHRLDFYLRNRHFLVAAAIIFVLLSLIFSLLQGLTSFIILSLAVFLGIIYNLKIFPLRWLSKVKIQRLRDIPASKDIAVALAWATIVVIIPVIDKKRELFSPGSVAVFLFIAILSYIRSVIFGIRGIQEDTIVGKEATSAVIGKEKIKIILGLLTAAMAIVLLFSGIMGYVTGLSYYMILVALFTAIYLYLYHRRIIAKGIWFEAVVDVQLFIAGITALLWSIYTNYP